MNQPAPQWKVVGTNKTVRMIGMGQPTEGWDVQYLTDKGIQGSVFVPENQIGNLDYVRLAVQGAVDSIHAIHDLTP